MAVCIGKKYALGKRLGSGSFGEIFQGRELQSGKRVAIKLELRASRHPQLAYETRIYRMLGGGPGIPAVHWFGSEGKYNVMVMDLLGSSLEKLFNDCGRTFSLKTVLMLADQMLARLEYVHGKQLVHRDIKPDNFLLGKGPFESVLFLIDYGLSKRYLDPRTGGTHIPFRDDKQLTGTARYASLHAHLGREQSRRDDLEAVGYVLLYFLLGKLPWQGLEHSSDEDKYERIRRKKESTSLEELCRDAPPVFQEYLQTVRQLAFEETPNYGSLRRLFTRAMTKAGYQMDYAFDWRNGCALAKPALTAASIASVADSGRVVELLK